MAKRRITPERREQRKKLLEMLQDAGINDVAGVQDLFKEMVSTVLENGLEAELDEELGYSNMTTAISRPITAAMATVKRP
jgi:transposase-like protein